MFHFPPFAPAYAGLVLSTRGFPIRTSPGKVDWHLTEAYRSHSTSFIALYNLGIHHTPFHSRRECCTPLYNVSSVVCAYLRTLCVIRRGRKDPPGYRTILTRRTYLPHETAEAISYAPTGVDSGRTLRICSCQSNNVSVRFSIKKAARCGRESQSDPRRASVSLR